MRRVYSYWPDDCGEPLAVLRDDELCIPLCLRCQLPLAESDEDEALGLPIGTAEWDEPSGWSVVVCANCRASSHEASR